MPEPTLIACLLESSRAILGPMTNRAIEFLRVRHILAQANNLAQLDRHDATLKVLAASHPDAAAEILTALSTSDDTGAKETVAIYAGHLYPARPDSALRLICAMCADSDTTIQKLAYGTLKELESDDRFTPTQAAAIAVASKQNRP